MMTHMAETTTTGDIQAWATALPEVTEKQHFRFKMPIWQVRGKTVLGMGRDPTTAVVCVTEKSGEQHAAADGHRVVAITRRLR